MPYADHNILHISIQQTRAHGETNGKGLTFNMEKLFSEEAMFGTPDQTSRIHPCPR